ncbi:mRNA interferase YafQ [hydrothermal vent metagenome]|uniref:mRNA interferase YafQ n=1 Tax=hydrothermal vent metagenome TaxID=652676 RepID=A0A3B1AU84_9ZZZZ
MYSAIYTGQFKRDVKRAKKRGKDLDKLREILTLLLDGSHLPSKYGDHPLKGEWKPSRDLHIESDWLLIYCVVGDAVRFERTGSHADLFKK